MTEELIGNFNKLAEKRKTHIKKEDVEKMY